MSQTAALFLPPWQPLADQLLRVWTAIGIKSSIAGIPTTDRAAVLAEQLVALAREAIPVEEPDKTIAAVHFSAFVIQ